jgi:hypothetical protein
LGGWAPAATWNESTAVWTIADTVLVVLVNNGLESINISVNLLSDGNDLIEETDTVIITGPVSSCSCSFCSVWKREVSDGLDVVDVGIADVLGNGLGIGLGI